MAGRGKLIASTVVRDPESQKVVTLRAGSKVPDWAEDQVGDHLFEGKSKGSADKGSEAASATGTPAAGEGNGAGGEPPRAGRGSGLEVWKAYAGKQGITVPEGAQREDIIALVDAAKQA